MRVASAIALMESLVYEPGWEILIQDYTHRFEYKIYRDHVLRPLPLRAGPGCEQGYPEAIRPRASFCIPVGDIANNVGVLPGVAQQDHRLQNAQGAGVPARIKPTMWAPLNCLF